MRVSRPSTSGLAAIFVWVAFAVPIQGQPASFSPSQDVDVVSEGQSGVYLWEFGTSDSRWEEHTGNYSFLWDVGVSQWTGLYLYDYQMAAWPGALFAFRRDWDYPTNLSVTMVPVPADSFTMGNGGWGDDATAPVDFINSETPTHTVALSAYEIGRYEVTNGEFCEVLNWALAQGHLKNAGGGAYTDGNIYANGELLLAIDGLDSRIRHGGGGFQWGTQIGSGGLHYFMGDHPVTDVSWYGAVAFCNWQSEMDGLTPAYDLSTWELVDADLWSSGLQFTNGYRLPTEAEWEHAAAWDGVRHFVYSFLGDTLTGSNRCNFVLSDNTFVSPFGLISAPYTSPVGWFNGVNVSPNGGVQTLHSLTRFGIYDMSGNISEWCQDWYAEDYYEGGAMTDPLGPGSGSYRTVRGGSWCDLSTRCRSAYRYSPSPPSHTDNRIGFRVARTPSGP